MLAPTSTSAAGVKAESDRDSAAGTNGRHYASAASSSPSSAAGQAVREASTVPDALADDGAAGTEQQQAQQRDLDPEDHREPEDEEEEEEEEEADDSGLGMLAAKAVVHPAVAAALAASEAAAAAEEGHTASAPTLQSPPLSPSSVRRAVAARRASTMVVSTPRGSRASPPPPAGAVAEAAEQQDQQTQLAHAEADQEPPTTASADAAGRAAASSPSGTAGPLAAGSSEGSAAEEPAKPVAELRPGVLTQSRVLSQEAAPHEAASDTPSSDGWRSQAAAHSARPRQHVVRISNSDVLSPPPRMAAQRRIDEEAEGDDVFARTTSPRPRPGRNTGRHRWTDSPDSGDESIGRNYASDRRDKRRGSVDVNKTPTTSDGEEELSQRLANLHRVERQTPIKRRQGELSLLVGGRRFIVDDTLFDKQPDTMLGRMFSSAREARMAKPNDNGDYVIEHPVSPEAFAAILKFYRDGSMRCPPTVSVSELHEACQYFLVPFTHISVQCEDLGKLLHELSNQGAIKQFETFLHRSLLPAMARCAELGERFCHIAILSETDTVEWDEDLPPNLGEQYAKVVHDSSLSRFLYSYENRTIAKKQLKDRGLKKIRIGIEGFPTYVERVKHGPNGEKIEVEYHYDQRPFLMASWETEESKSRHVDFQYVRTSSQTTNVLSTVMTS